MRVVLLFGILVLATGCESALESVEAEDFDADHRLRYLRHERGLDFEWVNARMQHVVRVVIPASPDVLCSGVLVGPDLVLTAAHCLRGTAYNPDLCDIERTPGREPGDPPVSEGNVFLDYQFEQDTHVNGEPASGTPRFSRSIGIIEVVAHPEMNVSDVNVEEGTCNFHEYERHFDGTLLRLAESVTDRGFARIRTSDTHPGELLPVIHLRGTQKTVSAVVAQPDSPGGGINVPNPDAHIMRRIDLPVLPFGDAEQLVNIQRGSSGAPLFDEEGYVIGLVSRPLLGEDWNDIIFASTAALFSLAEFQAAVAPAEEISGVALGTFSSTPFDTSPFQGQTLERETISALAELPRAITAMPGASGFLTAGFATNADGEHVFALAAYDASGNLDLSFGDNGIALHDVPDTLSENEELVDIIYQPRPLAAASLGEPDSMAAARFMANGDPDNTFGSSSPGVTRITVPGAEGASAAAIAIASDGSILVAGHAAVDTGEGPPDLHGSPVVARLNSSGLPAGGCGPGHVFTWRPEATANVFTAETLEQYVETLLAPTYDMVVTDMALDATDGIILVGYLHTGSLHRRTPWVGRLNADCSPDNSFGPSTTGVHVFNDNAFENNFADAPDNAWFSAVAIDELTGTIYTAGTLANYDSTRGFFAGNMFVVAFTPAGLVERRFSPEPFLFGGAVVPSDGWHEEATAIAIASEDGGESRVVLAGFSYQEVGATRRRVRMASYFTDGAGGNAETPFNPVGVVDAWATDAVAVAGGGVVTSVAHRSNLIVDPFPNPPPGP